MKIAIEVKTDKGEMGTNKELEWRWLDTVVAWLIMRRVMREADRRMLEQIKKQRKGDTQ